MHSTSQYKLKANKDVELNWDRQDIDYFVTLPDEGVRSDTGVLMVVDGLGGMANSYYQASEVRPYLANRYNCIVVGVNYFGIGRAGSYHITNEFYYNINAIYGLGITPAMFQHNSDVNYFFNQIAQMLLHKGVINMDVRCQPVAITANNEYQSWGFLPAVDCLGVLGAVLARYPEVNKKRIIAYGHGYGGYIALLMSKFAPHTFSAVVDKGGYVKSEVCHIATGEMIEPDHVVKLPITDFPRDFEISMRSNNPWTLEDEESPYFFSDSHRRIRSLLIEDHLQESPTRYYIFHGEKDGVVTIDQKEKMVGLWQQYHPVTYRKMGSNDMENGTVKNLQSDLGLNHQDLFDLAAKAETDNFAKDSPETDFDRNSKYRFPCGERDYVFSFQPDGALKVSIQQSRKSKSVKIG